MLKAVISNGCPMGPSQVDLTRVSSSAPVPAGGIGSSAERLELSSKTCDYRLCFFIAEAKRFQGSDDRRE
jgi:hypothetical protein